MAKKNRAAPEPGSEADETLSLPVAGTRPEVREIDRSWGPLPDDEKKSARQEHEEEVEAEEAEEDPISEEETEQSEDEDGRWSRARWLEWLGEGEDNATALADARYLEDQFPEGPDSKQFRQSYRNMVRAHGRRGSEMGDLRRQLDEYRDRVTQLESRSQESLRYEELCDEMRIELSEELRSGRVQKKFTQAEFDATVRKAARLKLKQEQEEKAKSQSGSESETEIGFLRARRGFVAEARKPKNRDLDFDADELVHLVETNEISEHPVYGPLLEEWGTDILRNPALFFRALRAQTVINDAGDAAKGAVQQSRSSKVKSIKSKPVARGGSRRTDGDLVDGEPVEEAILDAWRDEFPQLSDEYPDATETKPPERFVKRMRQVLANVP